MERAVSSGAMIGRGGAEMFRGAARAARRDEVLRSQARADAERTERAERAEKGANRCMAEVGADAGVGAGLGSGCHLGSAQRRG